jgi:tRNA pseudouridine65 synthase
MTSLPILYHDEHLVAVNKPAGLLVHRSFIDPRETRFALQILRDQLGCRVYPFHRLDKATSGVLLFALDQETARTMTEVFTNGLAAKSYLVVVRGFTAAAGRIDHPLWPRRDRRDDPRADRDKPAQEAVTDYQRLATVELPYAVGRYATARFSLLSAEPLTGRTHQIRRHLKHLFHPVIGDTTYGDNKQNEFFRKELGCGRLLLHGRELAFRHPAIGEAVRISAPLDEAFQEVLRRLGWEVEG